MGQWPLGTLRQRPVRHPAHPSSVPASDPTSHLRAPRTLVGVARVKSGRRRVRSRRSGREAGPARSPYSRSPSRVSSVTRRRRCRRPRSARDAGSGRRGSRAEARSRHRVSYGPGNRVGEAPPRCSGRHDHTGARPGSGAPAAVEVGPHRPQVRRHQAPTCRRPASGRAEAAGSRCRRTPPGTPPPARCCRSPTPRWTCRPRRRRTARGRDRCTAMAQPSASGSRATGQLMQRGPPRPEPSSEPAIRTTSMPASSSRALVSSLRS